MAIGFGVWQLVTKETPASAAKSGAVPVYSPYVDVTLTPTYPFQLPSANPVSSVYLAFVVSDNEEACTPSWGTFYTLDSAESGLDLDARAAQLRSQGGSVMISYGGQANAELAVDCTDPAKLQQAYLEPIQRYKAKAIDLDIEGANLADTAANARRATAIAAVQKELAQEKKPLQVWMTLPVSSHGLTAEGIAAVQAMLKAKVDLAGVNAMTMDFGPGEGAEKDMLGTIERALEATQIQVQSLWRAAGLPSSAGAAWGHVGVTPMLGVNDVTDQRFTTKDAKELAEVRRRARHPPRLRLVAEPRLRSAAAPSPRPANSPTPAAAWCRSRSSSPTSSAPCAEPRPRARKRPPPSAAARGQAADDHRRPEDQPLPDLAPVRRLRHRLQGRLAGTDLPGRLVEPGHPARYRRRRLAQRSLAADRPGPRRQQGAEAGEADRQRRPRRGRRPRVYHEGDRVELRRPALPGPLVHAGRTAAGPAALRPERPLGTAVQVPGRAELRSRNRIR